MSEILLEQIVVSSSNYNMYIGIYPRDSRPGYFLDPYFKVYNNMTKSHADKVARISILRPEYIKNHKYDKKPYNLSRKEIGFILKLLRDDITINGIKYNSAWNFICSYITKNAQDHGYKVDYNSIPMSDYRKLI